MEVCPVVKRFFFRLLVLGAAGLLFLSFIGWRIARGRENRDYRTFIADVSKQAGQQAMGGVMMVLLGTHLSERGYSPLAWYGALFPFEVILTTLFTGSFRRITEAHAARFATRYQSFRWAQPLANVGQYGPAGMGDWRWSWYFAQLVQATLLIGLPARLCALSCISLSLWILPAGMNPCAALAHLYFNSGLSCDQQAAIILYVMPVFADATQFIIIDRLQASSRSVPIGSGPPIMRSFVAPPYDEELMPDPGSARLFSGMSRTDSSVTTPTGSPRGRAETA